MKRSRHIALAIIASVSLTACGPDKQATQRDMYKNREDCVKDWNSDDCEETAASSGSHGYIGPHYYSQGSRPYYYPRSGSAPLEATGTSRFAGVEGVSASPRASHAVASTISRGGFGHMGGIFGSGRS